MRRRVQCACPGMLTEAMIRTMPRLTDEKITVEENRNRSEMAKQSAEHLSDLRRFQTPLQSLRLIGEDLGPLVH